MDSSDEEEAALGEARINFGATFTRKSTDKKQPVNSLTWELVDYRKLPRTCVREKVEGNMGTEYPAQILNVKEELNSMFKIFMHFCPPTWIKAFVDTANVTLLDDPIDKNYRQTTPGEMTAILGLELAASVLGVGNFSSCFAIQNDPDSLFPPAAFGQYGICKNRALIVGRAAHLSAGPQRPAGATPHWFIDDRLREFNDHMAMCYRSSWLGCMDETGPAWHGGEGEDDYNKCPHVTFVPRKPEPVCAEFNDIVCALSRVLVMLEYEKASKYHKDEEYVEELGSYNAAMTVRLTAPFANRNATVYGDSRFGQVRAAFSSWKKHKAHSLFDIKTGTSLFPRADIIRLCAKDHGSIVVMQAQIEDLTLYAIGQRRGPAVHTFLSTCGTFERVIPVRFKHMFNINECPWTTINILNKVTMAQPAIDTFNRQLFDLLGMQYTFPTRCFETRLSKQFLMPCVYINTINAAKYHFASTYGDEQTKPLLMKLASEMVRNPEWAEERNHPDNSLPGMPHMNYCRSGKRYNPAERTWQQVRIDGGPPSRESPAKHVLILLSQLEGYRGSKQQRCWECNELVSWCCARCSSAASWVPLHPPVAQGSKKHYGCLAAHRANPAGGYKASHQVHSGTAATAKRRRRIPMEVL
jgi:hypothetical protein